MKNWHVRLAVALCAATLATAQAVATSRPAATLRARLARPELTGREAGRSKVACTSDESGLIRPTIAGSPLRELAPGHPQTDAISQWDWPEMGYDRENSGWIKTIPLSDVVEPLLWEDWPYWGSVWSGHPVVSGDIMVFGGSDYMRAYDITDATVLWENNIVPGGPGYQEGNFAIFTYNGAEYVMGAFYTGGGATGTEANAAAYKLSDGSTLWTQTWDINMPVWHFATPTIVGSKAYYATFDYDQNGGSVGPGHLLEVDLATGAISSVGTFTTGSGPWGAAQATDGTFIYPACGSLDGLGVTGKVEKWNLTSHTQAAVSQSMGEPAWGGTSYAEFSGTGYVYAVSATDQATGGHVWCFKASDLSLKWSVATNDGFDCQVPTVTDNGVYVCSQSGGRLYAFDPLTGAQLPGWSAQYISVTAGQDGQIAATGRTGSGERLYVADGNGILVVDQNTGSTIQSVSYAYGSGYSMARPAGYCVFNSTWDDIVVYEVNDQTMLAHDVGVTAILQPASNRIGTGDVIVPKVTVTNFGLNDEYDVPVYFEADLEGSTEYTGYFEVPTLLAGASADVELDPDWTVGAQLWHGYTIDAYTQLSGDGNTANDHFGMYCLVTADTIFSNRSLGDGPPTIDGLMSPGEWSEAYKVNASNVFGWFGTAAPPEGAYAYFMHDATYLYMAYDVPEDLTRSVEDQVQFFCDENNNGAWEMGLTEGQHSMMFNGTSDVTQYRPWMPTSPPSPGSWMSATGSLSASGIGSGHMQFEARVPFGSDLWQLGLNPAGDTAGVWFFELAGPVASATTYGWWRSELSDADATYPDHYGKLILLPPPAPTVGVTAPNGGEVWTVAEHHDITWTSANSTTDSICYSTDNGTTWTFIGKQTPPTHTYDWTIPNTPSTNCLVKVSAIGISTVEDASNAVFEIRPLPPTTFNLLLPEDDAVNVPVSGSLTWEASTGATSYTVFLGTNELAPDSVTNVTGPSYAYSGLANTTDYYWTIVAKNAGGRTPTASGTWHFTTITAGGDVHDVGVTEVLRPASFEAEGRNVYPRMTVENFGTVAEANVKVRCIITDGTDAEVFNQYEVVPSLPVGGSVNFEFATNYWTASPVGGFNVRCTTELDGDMARGNDKSAHDFEVVALLHDVGVSEVLVPAGNVVENTIVWPKMTVENYGTETEGPFDVRCVITEEGNPTPVFDHVEEVTSIGPGTSVEFDFTSYSWTASPQGDYHVLCQTELLGDMVPENDETEHDFTVGPAWPRGWVEVKNVPDKPTAKQVKDGGWLATGPDRETDAEVVYAAKGNKTTDFFKYYPLEDSWAALKPIQADEGGREKPPKKGCMGVSDGAGAIYMTKGANTLGFWKYDIEGDTWTRLPDVPLGLAGKKVKGGTDLAYVTDEKDSGWVYLMKGYKTEFYRYSVESNRWDTLDDVPYTTAPKYGPGSFLVYEGEQYLYAQQAKYTDASKTRHFMFRYDLGEGKWDDSLKGMPVMGMYGGKMKLKKSKDGGSGAWYDGRLYALKGGNTCQFYRYEPTGDTWTELDTINSYGSTAKKKRVKAGGDLASYGHGAFFATKGNKTYEFWRYVIPAVDRKQDTGNRGGVQANPSTIYDLRMTISPNPMANGFATLRFSLAKAGPVSVSVYDALGRAVLRQAYGVQRKTSSVPLDLRSLSAGVYLVRLDADGYRSSQKLVVQR